MPGDIILFLAALAGEVRTGVIAGGGISRLSSSALELAATVLEASLGSRQVLMILPRDSSLRNLAATASSDSAKPSVSSESKQNVSDSGS